MFRIKFQTDISAVCIIYLLSLINDVNHNRVTNIMVKLIHDDIKYDIAKKITFSIVLYGSITRIEYLFKGKKQRCKET